MKGSHAHRHTHTHIHSHGRSTHNHSHSHQHAHSHPHTSSAHDHNHSGEHGAHSHRIHQNSRDCSTGSGQSVTNRFLVRPMTSLRNVPQPERFTDDLGLNKGKQELMRLMLPFLCAVLLSGCINITNELQPGTPDVKPVLIGEDCTPIVLGMGLGTNTIENAKKDGRVLGDPGEFRSRIKLNDRTAITRIRTVQMTDFYILLVGSSCIQVIGEP